MHITEMKKHEFIKNKVMEHIVKTSVEKATLISHTNVTHGINDSNETSHVWMVQNQQHPNMTYKVPLPFTKYACFTCEWALCANLCKHQVLILLTCTNLIQYCGTWYGYDCGCFATMFVNRTYLQWIWWWKGWWRSLWRTMGCWYVWAYDIRWYLPQWGKRKRSQSTFKFIHIHRENACLNGWHNARNHQWNQKRWVPIHRPHHIIVACYYNKCMRYLPFQCKWSHAFWHGISLRQWWI
jgi:hypothetical protein